MTKVDYHHNDYLTKTAGPAKVDFKTRYAILTWPHVRAKVPLDWLEKKVKEAAGPPGTLARYLAEKNLALNLINHTLEVDPREVAAASWEYESINHGVELRISGTSIPAFQQHDGKSVVIATVTEVHDKAKDWEDW